MGMIRILDDATINQIAAGEVVERPSSVVKELIENSLDAGATRITITLKDGGKSYIQIRDNGSGMSREDARLAFEKHATSKIRDIEDIFTIVSLGFRGEALSSIASVSQTTLVTRAPPGTLDSDGYTGTKIVIEGGVIKKTEEIGCPAGTTITVENLFFNVPARLKYLKSDRTELNHVLSVVTERALAYPEVFFELSHEGRRLILSPGSGDLIETISSIIGKTAARQMMEVNFACSRARISGYISRPSHTRANQNHVHLFINRRPVRSPNIVRAIRDGFGTLLPPVRYPVGVIELTVDPSEIDVNIHPAKSAVKFQYPDDVQSCVTDAVRHAMKGKDLSVKASLATSGRKGSSFLRKGLFTEAEKRRMKVAEARAKYTPAHEFPDPSDPTPTRLVKGQQIRIDQHGGREEGEGKEEWKGEMDGKREISGGYGKGARDGKREREWKGKGEMDGKREISGEYGEGAGEGNGDRGWKEEMEGKEEWEGMGGWEGRGEGRTRMATPISGTGSSIPFMRPVGQVGNLFIIVETEDGLAIIDQHAAHERVMYESLKRNHRDDPVKQQRLIEPISLELAPEEQEAVKTYRSILAFLGFEIDEFGGNTFMVRTVPVTLGKHITPETIYDIIDELVATGKVRGPEEQKDAMLKLLACHSAIRGGEELSMPRIEKLLEELLPLENPFTCPHGRPTIVRMTTKELEKKFKRTGF